MRAFLACALTLLSACAAGSARLESTAAPSPTPKIAANIEAVAWIHGVWVQQSGSQRVEEFWTPPAGGMLLAATRMLDGDKLLFFEHLRIEERDGSLVFVALPRGRPGAEFSLARIGEREALFENLANDFPQRILYRLESDGSLFARIEGQGSQPSEWRMRPWP